MDYNNRNNNFNNSMPSSFLTTSMALWQRQSATAWIDIYKEFAAYSQKISESWSDAFWKTWAGKEEDPQSKER
jgi:hypothetical protein